MIKITDFLRNKSRINENANQLSPDILWHDMHGTLPHVTKTKEIYHQDLIFEKFRDKVAQIHSSYDEDYDVVNKNFTIIYDENLIIQIYNCHPETRKHNGVKAAIHYGELFCYHNDEYDFEKITELFKEFETTKSKRKEPHISIITNEYNELVLRNFNIKNRPMNLDLNYGKDFKKIHDTIVARLNKKDDKGIVVLYGDPGTGKTEYIRYLLTILKKDVIYLPPHMTASLSDPSFITFLMNYENSVLVLEDAENAIRSREESGSMSSVSNLLNISDGILSDCLKMQLIVTFNTEKTSIDQALLRPGRLIAEHKFEALSLEDTKTLVEHLKLEIEVTEGMTLTSIYNHTEKDSRKKPSKKIGFNR